MCVLSLLTCTRRSTLCHTYHKWKKIDHLTFIRVSANGSTTILPVDLKWLLSMVFVLLSVPQAYRVLYCMGPLLLSTSMIYPVVLLKAFSLRSICLKIFSSLLCYFYFRRLCGIVVSNLSTWRVVTVNILSLNVSMCKLHDYLEEAMFDSSTNSSGTIWDFNTESRLLQVPGALILLRTWPDPHVLILSVLGLLYKQLYTSANQDILKQSLFYWSDHTLSTLVELGILMLPKTRKC